MKRPTLQKYNITKEELSEYEKQKALYLDEIAKKKRLYLGLYLGFAGLSFVVALVFFALFFVMENAGETYMTIFCVFLIGAVALFYYYVKFRKQDFGDKKKKAKIIDAALEAKCAPYVDATDKYNAYLHDININYWIDLPEDKFATQLTRLFSRCGYEVEESDFEISLSKNGGHFVVKASAEVATAENMVKYIEDSPIGGNTDSVIYISLRGYDFNFDVKSKDYNSVLEAAKKRGIGITFWGTENLFKLAYEARSLIFEEGETPNVAYDGTENIFDDDFSSGESEEPSEGIAETSVEDTQPSSAPESSHEVDGIGKDIKTDSFSVNREGMTIAGLYIRPGEGKNLPVAIVCHGLMATYGDYTKTYAVWFAEHGYAAICFDFNGGGDPSESSGKTEDMTIFTEAEDLKAVMAYVRTLPEVNADDITLMGCSQGGIVAGLVAAEYMSKIKNLILFYPGFCISDCVRAGKILLAEFDPENVPETVACGRMTLGREYILSVQNIDFIETLKVYDGRVLIVHGSDDALVDWHYSERAQKAYPNAELKLIKGADHVFSEEYDKIALGYVEKFLSSEMDPE